MVFDVVYESIEGLTLGIDTELVVNYPASGLAALPISVNLAITRVAAKVCRLTSNDGDNCVPSFFI